MIQKDDVVKVIKGLNTDMPPISQPEGSYRFALNAVEETTSGDAQRLTTEQGDSIIANLPKGFNLVGHIYTSNDRIVLFSKLNDISEIGILYTLEDRYETVVNDKNSINKLLLGDNVYGIYRLRRGCEDTIYFVDGLSVRYFNFGKENNFKKAGLWDSELFKLQRTFSSSPEFEDIEIIDGGNIYPGSYSILVQYLDEDLNPTEWITASDTIIIYRDRNNKPFEDIRGDVSYGDEDNKTPTNKSIQVTLSNLDRNFPYYRIGVIESHSGTGNVTRVSTSEQIPTDIEVYTYSGETTNIISYEETQVFDNIIESAEHIEMVDNMLLLSNTQGKKVNYCELQKYASRIKTDCVTKEIVLNDIESHSNQKRGTLHIEDVGYQPGEIYSFGIVYVFEDGTKSPVFHIPGKNHSTKNTAFIQGAIPMSTDNQLASSYYVENDTCDDNPFWGTDSEGDILSRTTKVRHHRFPTRSEAKIGFVKTITDETEGSSVRTLNFTFRSTHKKSNLGDGGPAEIKIGYYIGGVRKEVTRYVDEFLLAVNTFFTIEVDNIINKTIDSERPDGTVTKFDFTVTEIGEDGADDVVLNKWIKGQSLFLTEGASESFIDKEYKANILGVAFSNIDLPNDDIVGYYIVRQKRDEFNKTILDTGLMLPTLKETYYSAFGLLRPSTGNGTANGDRNLESRIQSYLKRNETSTNLDFSRIRGDIFGLIHPQFLFNKVEYPTATIKHEGYWSADNRKFYMNHELTEDVMAGTSYDSSRNKKREKDSDGFTLHTLTRYSPTDTYKSATNFTVKPKDIFYLDTLYGKTVKDSANESTEIYNLSADNRIGIIQNETKLDPSQVFKDNSYPYVTIERQLLNPYSDFRVTPYYMDSKRMHKFGDTPKLFSGDSYISPMTFTSSMYYNSKIRKRKNKKSWLKFVLGIVLVAAAVVITVFTASAGSISLVAASAALGAAGASVSLGMSMLANGFKQAQANRVYNDLYNQGLKDCVNDRITSEVFDNYNPDDDELQWVSDSLGNLWFESQINMNWRLGIGNMPTDFLNSPSKYSESFMADYTVNKLTTFDKDNTEGKLYQGFANPEVYIINPDYTRRNWTKNYFMLGIEYDCCSECQEEFPHRVVYSQQSFQEELTDNFRKFLPNNYRDLNGESGEITNMFRLGNNLYIHTEHAMWLIPRNYQERVTDQIVSFLGTGEFFSVPPQRLRESTQGISAGLTKHQKNSALVTPYGYFFVSDKEKVIYQFDGEKGPIPISNNGMKAEIKYLINDGDYVTGYDPILDRMLFTKLGDNGWTLSYSLPYKAWRSYHTYIPDRYLTARDKFLSWDSNKSPIWLHNSKGYCNFRGANQEHIIEYVSLDSALITKQWNHIRLDTEAYTLDGEFLFDTFDKALLYNNIQCSGVLNLAVTEDSEDYFFDRISNSNDGDIILDRVDDSWYFNDFYNMKSSTTPVIWKDPHRNVYTKELVMEDVREPNWFDTAPIEGKYCIVRLTKSKDKSFKLSTNFNISNEQPKF